MNTSFSLVHSRFCPYRRISFVLYSEIRLMEILEGLCDSSSFECNRMVEEQEEHFETWWFKRWAQAKVNNVTVTAGSVSPVKRQIESFLASMITH